MLASAALALLLTGRAVAFAPDPAVDAGALPERVYHVHPHIQARLLRTPGWREFTLGDGAGWMARFDEVTGTPHRMWGPGIPLERTASADEIDASLRAFLAGQLDLVGVPLDHLVTRSVHPHPRLDLWIVHYDVHAAGVRVVGAGVTARIRDGELVMLGIDTYPGLAPDGAPRLNEDQAIHHATSSGLAPEADHVPISTELVAVPEVDGQRARLRLAWEVRTHTEHPPGRWVAHVDAHHGELLALRNDLRFGTVLGVHDQRTVDETFATSPMPLILVEDDGSYLLADEEGDFASASTVGLTSILRGSYLRVYNAAGAEGSLEWDGEVGTWTTAAATQAEIDTYVYLHQAREWGLGVAPEVAMVVGPVNSTVNLADTCNAYFDPSTGDVYFYGAGDGCNNIGRIADVAYHEWGHGFHFYSLPRALRYSHYDSSLGEGAADTIAFFQTYDPLMAPGFFTDGGGIRTADNEQRYPEDYYPYADYVHYNGLIFSGAMWDLWGVMVDEYGAEAGTALTEQLFADMLVAGPSIATSYDEMIVVDDDDADLSNGTPHQCLILEAFLAHGLGPNGSRGLVQPVHEPLSVVPAGTAHPISFDLLHYAEGCAEYTPTSASVTWRADGGLWHTTPLAVHADGADGAIPAQAPGSVVEYYFTLTGDPGSTIYTPQGTEINPFSFHVGDVIEVECFDFEQSTGGFSPESVSGGIAVDWQWGPPAGLSGDPDHAASGAKVWGNDLGGGDTDGAYENERHNRLESPPIDTAHYLDTFLLYQRWLTVEDGYYDHAVIRADDKMVWSNWATSEWGTQHHLDQQWAAHVVDLGGQGDDGTVELSWELETDQGLTFGGWTLDDVCVLAPATPDNRLAIVDFRASEDRTDGIQLQWTHPVHEPVDQVVVVRSGSHFPTGPTDGVVIWEGYSPVPGAEVSTLDTTAFPSKNQYYTVFASDGTDWLSWAVEGWNADTGNRPPLAVDDGGDDEDLEPPGCGCAAQGSAIPATWALLGLLLLGRGRRAGRTRAR